ncbi:MAG: VWA domain-containing protein [Planctomycetes bacterium]|nr:VWA domain-containing protein [Planctomycetota bacterium]
MSELRYGLEFTHPGWLAALVAVPWVVWYFRRSLVDFARWQRMVSTGVRVVIVVVLVLALAGLTWLRPTARQFVIVAVDQSVSVGGPIAANRFLDELLAAKVIDAEDRVAFVPFGLRPGVVSGERPKQEVGDGGGAIQSGDARSARHAELDGYVDGTDIAAVIEAAAATMPPDYVPRIVLLTDGNQTRGDALQAALATTNRGGRRELIPITTVPLPTRDDPEVQLSQVKVPAQVREGEPFYVEVVIDSNHDDEGLIEVFRGAHKVLSETRPLKMGENRFRFPQSIQRERLAEYSAKISGVQQDTLLDNNSDSGLVFMAGPPRVLLIDSDPKQTEHLVFALQQEDIQVDVRPPQGMPEDLADLQNYELLALSNVPATALTQRQMELARTYVQDLGGGFVMLGGDQSFGLGGYFKTVLEDILPVRSDFEKEKEKPGLAMVLVIDRSGSMAGQKLEMAKEAAKAAAELLGPKDQIGVICFDEAHYWVSPLQSAANKNRIADEISGIQVGGGTSLYPPLEEAYQTLVSSVSKLKHVIALTDGISNPGDFEGLAQNMASARITCTTVGVGNEAANDLLETIARIGQGRHFVANDPASLPQIFAKETLTVSKAAINEEPFLPQVIRPTQALAGIDFDSAPFLLGYVMTKPKATSELILASEKGDPVLAWWRYGLGTTVAFTSDAKSRWAAEWLTWPDFSKFWAQTIRHAMRKNDTKGVTVEVAQRARRATITLDAVDPTGRFLNGAESEVTIIDPRIGERKLPLVQTAPGRYVAEFDTPHSGAYHLNLSQRAANSGPVLHQQTRGLTVGYSDELRLHPTNIELLQQIASATGGRFDPKPSEALLDAASASSVPRLAQQSRPLWPELVMLALILFIFDVALRRIDLSVWLPAHWTGSALTISRPVPRPDKRRSEPRAVSRH